MATYRIVMELTAYVEADNKDNAKDKLFDNIAIDDNVEVEDMYIIEAEEQ